MDWIKNHFSRVTVTYMGCWAQDAFLTKVQMLFVRTSNEWTYQCFFSIPYLTSICITNRYNKLF